MTNFSMVVWPGVVVGLVAAAACGSPEDGGEAFPSRDWTGTYKLETVESSTDCQGAEAPPPLGDTALEVRQSIDNTATVLIGPLVALGGQFDGDELDALGTITQPIPLPDSLASRASETDSLETITYQLEATFREGQTLDGRYVIGAPDLNALASGSGTYRCQYVYEIRGLPLVTGRDRMEREGPGVRSRG